MCQVQTEVFFARKMESLECATNHVWKEFVNVNALERVIIIYNIA